MKELFIVTDRCEYSNDESCMYCEHSQLNNMRDRRKSKSWWSFENFSNACDCLNISSFVSIKSDDMSKNNAVSLDL